MIKEGKFESRQAIALLVITCLAKEFFTESNIIANKVGTAGWYMVLISAVVAAVGFAFVYALLKRFPGKSIVEIYDVVFGRYIGFVFSFLLAAVLLISAAINLREYIEVIKIYVFPKTQPSFLIISFILVVVILGFLGFENIARYSKLAAYLLMTEFIALFLLSSYLFEFYRLYPLLGYGLKNTLLQGFLRSSIFGEITLVAVFVKSLNETKEAKRIGYTSLIIAAVLLAIMQVGFILIFTYPFGQEIVAPLYTAASLIHYGAFFHRIEAMFLFVWNISILIEIPVLFYMVMLIYSHLFGINDRRPIIIPLAIILITMSLIPGNILELMTFYIRYIREYSWIVYYVFPAAALLVSVLSKKREDKYA